MWPFCGISQWCAPSCTRHHRHPELPSRPHRAMWKVLLQFYHPYTPAQLCKSGHCFPRAGRPPFWGAEVPKPLLWWWLRHGDSCHRSKVPRTLKAPVSTPHVGETRLRDGRCGKCVKIHLFPRRRMMMFYFATAYAGVHGKATTSTVRNFPHVFVCLAPMQRVCTGPLACTTVTVVVADFMAVTCNLVLICFGEELVAKPSIVAVDTRCQQSRFGPTKGMTDNRNAVLALRAGNQGLRLLFATTFPPSLHGMSKSQMNAVDAAPLAPSRTKVMHNIHDVG